MEKAQAQCQGSRAFGDGDLLTNNDSSAPRRSMEATSPIRKTDPDGASWYPVQISQTVREWQFSQLISSRGVSNSQHLDTPTAAC